MSAVVLTDWFYTSVNPTLIGMYEVRNEYPTKKKHLLVGGKMRYWNGIFWMTHETGLYKSIMGSHVSHQWRGVRKWILVRRKDPLTSAICGQPTDVYMANYRKTCVKFSLVPTKARTFKSKEAADHFAHWHAHLGLEAVML